MKPLIDELWDCGHLPFGPMIRMDFNDVAPKGQTQVFVLSPEIALAAENLVGSDTFSFPKMDEMRMPYPHTAIEYELTQEIREIRSHSTNNTESMEPTDRLGMYVREVSTEPRSFLCTPYWRYTGGLVSFCLFSFALGVSIPGSLHATMVLVRQGKERYSIALGEGPVDHPRGVTICVLPNSSALKALIKLGKSPKTVLESFFKPEMQPFIVQSLVEVPLFMFACNLILNCRTGMSKASVPAQYPPKGLGHIGERKRKQLSASAYTLLHLSALESVSSTGEVTNHVGTAAHYVRGHFKQRRSGVYWWNSFVRGTGEPRRREAYIVNE